MKYADENGNLLFYTNCSSGQRGTTPIDGAIWNRNKEVMLGLGNARGGGISSTQGGIIVPDPASNTRYYLLTVDDLESISDIYWPHNGIVYYLIDMQLVGGLGEADLPGFKNLEGLPRQSYGRKNSAAMTFRHRRVIQFFGKQTPASIISWV